MHEQWFDRTAAKDLDGLMGHIAPDIVSYEHAGPLQRGGIDTVHEVCRCGPSPHPRALTSPSRTWRSVCTGPRRGVETRPDRDRRCQARSRGTWVFQRRDGDCQMSTSTCPSPWPGD